MTNSIKNLLEIQDENIEIIGEIKEVKIKGQRTKIVEGKLRYQVEYCKCCKCQSKYVKKIQNKNVHFIHLPSGKNLLVYKNFQLF